MPETITLITTTTTRSIRHMGRPKAPYNKSKTRMRSMISEYVQMILPLKGNAQSRLRKKEQQAAVSERNRRIKNNRKKYSIFLYFKSKTPA